MELIYVIFASKY